MQCLRAKQLVAPLLHCAPLVERAFVFIRRLPPGQIPLRQRQALKRLLHAAQPRHFMDSLQLAFPFAVRNGTVERRNRGGQKLLFRKQCGQKKEVWLDGHSNYVLGTREKMGQALTRSYIFDRKERHPFPGDCRAKCLCLSNLQLASNPETGMRATDG